MAKSRRKKEVATGGVRPGAGRKETFDAPLRTAINIRVTSEQREALTKYVKKLSKQKGTRVDLSTWVRELALRESGNAHLGLGALLAAKAREKAKAAKARATAEAEAEAKKAAEAAKKVADLFA